jgi:hypothetical protein
MSITFLIVLCSVGPGVAVGTGAGAAGVALLDPPQPAVSTQSNAAAKSGERKNEKLKRV